jgi:crossover junction endodeoxyribonuclease RuvC
MEHLDHLLTPTIKVGTKNRLNGGAVAAWLRQFTKIDHVFIEKVNAMPSGGVKMGAGSAFTFGHSAGYVEGVVAGMGLPITLVTPQQWKKANSLIGTGKDEARSRCTQLYPELRVLDLKGKGQAVADAILIARYGITHTLNRN